MKKKQVKYCDECFAPKKDCECEDEKRINNSSLYREDDDEEWEEVPSPYKAYSKE